MSLSEITRRLRLEREALDSHEGPLPAAGVRALSARLKDLEGAIQDMIPSEQTNAPAALNAIAKTKSDSPALKKILEAGWSVRQLTEKLNTHGVKISHAYLGRMLKGEVDMKPEIKRGISEITKICLEGD